MAQLLPVDEFDLIIFGATGDLAMRKLLPALYHRDRDGQFSGKSRIIAASRRALSREAYLGRVKTSLQENLKPGEYEEAGWETFRKRIQYARTDASAPAEWSRLRDLLSANSLTVHSIIRPGQTLQIPD